MKQRISRTISHARAEAQRGAVLFLVVLTVLIVMIAGALAVDLSASASRGQSLQNAVDSAALAGVQAYRQSMGDRTEATAADEAAAVDAVNALLAQNGITGLTPVVTFSDPENDTEVTVTLKDDDPGLLLSEFTGVGGSVERSATARFERCADGCIQRIEIPEPFRSVDTTGDGDGYKPIPVGDRLYALNHNATSLQIVCVDRATQAHCWPTGPGKNAYPSSLQPPRTPEMPNAAVVGTRIFWTVTTSSGHYLFCFETETATPCSNPYKINNSTRVSSNETRTQNRGGGTFSPDGTYVYTFTDDHRVHCIHPYTYTDPNTGVDIFVMEACAGYESNGIATGLGRIGFPANDAALGNHGSSIDRIFDPVENRVYHTLHIDAVPGSDCADPNMAVPSGVVVLKNAVTGHYIGINDSYNGFIDILDASDTRAHWTISGGTSNGYRFYRFESVAALDDGYYRYIANDSNGLGLELDLVSGSSSRRVWRVIPEYSGATSSIRSWYTWSGYYHYMKEDVVGGAPAFLTDFYDSGDSDWIIRPWECELPDDGPEVYEGVEYTAGTFIDCFDLTLAQDCISFSPSRLHADWDSFSGRIFFYYGSGANPQITGLCSTGFTEHWEWKDMSAYTELSCVDIVDGSERGDLEFSMPQFVSALAATNTGYPAWGTWGDPHYNAHTNRLFYPTHRQQSRVLCWDFDYGWCGQVEGYSADNGAIQDYGFFSEGNCVFGLGHNAVFWAFSADDIFEECSGSTKTTEFAPCPCGGEYYWGTLQFDVDIDEFESFYIEITTTDGTRVYPPFDPNDPDDPGHSLHTDGDIIDLNHLDASDPDQRFLITVSVEAEGDPWANADQFVEIQFERTPRLTE